MSHLTAITPVDSTGVDATDTSNHAVRVSVVSGGGTGGTASSFGAVFPATGTAVGASDGTNMVPLKVDVTGALVVSGGGGGGGGASTIADGADVAEGATTDLAVVTDVAGTVSGKLRGLVKIFSNVWDSVLGALQVREVFKTTSTSTTFTAGLQTLTLDVTGMNSAVLATSGTGTGSLIFESSSDAGVTYINLDGYSRDPGTSIYPVTAFWNIDNPNTAWVFPLQGVTKIRITANPFTAGSLVSTLTASTQPFRPFLSAAPQLIGGSTSYGQSVAAVVRNALKTTLVDPASGSALGVTSALADAASGPANTLEVDSYPRVYNGATFDRVRGDIANGLDVDVTRVSGVVHIDDNAGSLTVDGTVGVSGNVTVIQGTGSNLHTVLDSGTLTSITNVVHVDDNAGSLTVDGSLTAVGTITNVVHVDDNAGSLTVDGTVTTSPPANATTNVTQWAGTAVTLNKGASDAGTLRVSLGDSTQVIGHVIVDSGGGTPVLPSTSTLTKVPPAWRQTVSLLAANASRKEGMIVNKTNASFFLHEGAGATDVTYVEVLPPSARYTFDATVALSAFWNELPTDGYVFVTERT